MVKAVKGVKRTQRLKKSRTPGYNELPLFPAADFFGDQETGVSAPKKKRMKDVRNLPALPDGLSWPPTTFSEENARSGIGIIAYLEARWLPLIKAGIPLDLNTLRKIDPSAAKGINNYRVKDSNTGVRRSLPPHLDIPTKKEVTDRIAARYENVSDAPARVYFALKQRAHRSKMRAARKNLT